MYLKRTNKLKALCLLHSSYGGCFQQHSFDRQITLNDLLMKKRGQKWPIMLNGLLKLLYYLWVG